MLWPLVEVKQKAGVAGTNDRAAHTKRLDCARGSRGQKLEGLWRSHQVPLAGVSVDVFSPELFTRNA
jgi:phosphoketolase